jgi:D-alanyl-D-alanine endopeptidase (penicillin-binding protein 7)
VLGLPAESRPQTAAKPPATSSASKPTGSAKPSQPATTAARTSSSAKSATPAKTTAAKATTPRDTPAAAAKPTVKKATTTRSSAASRRRAAARAAQARALAEAQQPRLKLDANGVEVPDVRAEAAIIYNPQTGEVLWESNSQDQRSIASITKVMTAVVYLENNPDLDAKVLVDRSDVRAASTTVLRAGYKVTANDLLHLTLIASDNAAARALARTSPQGTQGFIKRMNQKAQELGLTSTSYVDTSGLLSGNVSSAYDMARLIAHVSDDPRIAGPMRTQYYDLPVGKRKIQVHSTNQLVMRGDVDVEAGKTGFIRKAGYCLATLLRLPDGGPPVAVVVLGAKSNAGRFWETRHLLSWLSSQASAIVGRQASQPQPAQAN